MSSNDVGSYEFQRSPCEMQMEECSATLARSTSDGSADNHRNSISDSNNSSTGNRNRKLNRVRIRNHKRNRSSKS